MKALRRARLGVYHFLSRHHGGVLTRIGASAARGYLSAYEGAGSHKMEYDGEGWLLEKLGAIDDIRTVFDVGANVGVWSDAALAAFPNATIHAFEIVPTTAARLVEHFAGSDRVITNTCGLSDEDGEVSVGVGDLRTMSSFVVDVPKQVATETAQVRKGDDYASEHHLDHIDFLKVDTEGADHLVLQGFEGMLSGGHVDVIQFEYGQFALTTRFLLADFYKLLEAHGFAIGKLFPRGVDFRAYDPQHEDFRGLNYVAVRKDQSDLINLLRLSGK